VVSDRLVHRATRCIASPSKPSASRITATGFPRYGVVENTSTWAKSRDRGMSTAPFRRRLEYACVEHSGVLNDIRTGARRMLCDQFLDNQELASNLRAYLAVLALASGFRLGECKSAKRVTGGDRRQPVLLLFLASGEQQGPGEHSVAVTCWVVAHTLAISSATTTPVSASAPTPPWASGITAACSCDSTSAR
jgi:hypothetical protein